MDLKALILAGGKGTRLRPITLEIPKPLVEIRQRPMIDYVMRYLAIAGVDDIYVAVNYKKEKIRNYLGDRVRFIETEGSIAHAIIQCTEFIDSPFICVPADVVQDPENVTDAYEWFERLNQPTLHHYSSGDIDEELILDYLRFQLLVAQDKGLFRTLSI